jgi:tetratricopeptide (TPR) repeat protein
MRDFNKIIELLDKNTLTAEEKAFLNNAFDTDPELKDLSKTYLLLKASLKRSGHIDEDQMGEYVLYKNNLTRDGVILHLTNVIEDHLRMCGECEALFKELNSEYAAVEDFFGHQDTRQSTIPGKAEQKRLSWFSSMSRAKYAFTSLAAVLIVYISLFAVSSVITPDYRKALIDDQEFYTTRGRTSELFQRGLDAIDRKDFDQAIKYLNTDLDMNRGEESIFYTHFVLGITYLHKAERNFLGLFESYDENDVQNGIENLNKSIDLNNSGSFDNLKMDAHYFIGKSYLMLDDKKSAKEHLEVVVENKGSYYKKASELLTKL